MFNPFTPESDQCQNSPAASQEIWHHTVWRTWLFIAYSDEKWLYYKFSLHHSYNRFLKGWENTLFELRSERVKGLWRVMQPCLNRTSFKGHRERTPDMRKNMPKRSKLIEMDPLVDPVPHAKGAKPTREGGGVDMSGSNVNDFLTVSAHLFCIFFSIIGVSSLRPGVHPYTNLRWHVRLGAS